MLKDWDRQRIAKHVEPDVARSRAALNEWRKRHPETMDYRIEQAADHLRHAEDRLRRLIHGDPELERAMSDFREWMDADGE